VAGSIAAATASLLMLNQAVGKASSAFGQITQAMINANPSQAIHGFISGMQAVPLAIGGMVAGIGAGVMLIHPVIGGVVAAIGLLGGYIGDKVIGVLHSFVDAMDSMVDQLGKYSPIVAAQSAMLQAKSIMFELQMAQIMQPMMSAWIEIKSAVLDVLLEFARAFAPDMKDFGQAMHDMVPYVKIGLALLIEAIASAVAALLDLWAIINNTSVSAWKNAVKANAFAIKANIVGDKVIGSAFDDSTSGNFADSQKYYKSLNQFASTTTKKVKAGGSASPGGMGGMLLEGIIGQIGEQIARSGASGGNDRQSISNTGLMDAPNSPDRDAVVALINMESAKLATEFRWEHESSRAACLGYLVNPISMYL
jgi:hypothetical protein